jgi:uncharacterized damage-inducible protein DinB
MSDVDPKLHGVIFNDLQRELKVTRAVLDRLPPEKFDWKPHARSMSLGQLASHVADLPGWALGTIGKDEMDASASPHSTETLKTRDQLLERFDKNVAALREAVKNFDAQTIDAPWTMRNGDQVIVTRPRSTVYRIWCINHMIHHRGQLCLYLRLLDVPVPTVYFNTADDPAWVFE